jgi:hypothetical protein
MHLTKVPPHLKPTCIIPHQLVSVCCVIISWNNSPFLLVPPHSYKNQYHNSLFNHFSALYLLVLISKNNWASKILLWLIDGVFPSSHCTQLKHCASKAKQPLLSPRATHDHSIAPKPAHDWGGLTVYHASVVFSCVLRADKNINQACQKGIIMINFYYEFCQN